MTPDEYLADEAVAESIEAQRLAAGSTEEANSILGDLQDALLLLLAGAGARMATRIGSINKLISKAYQRISALVDAGDIGATFAEKTLSNLEKAFSDFEPSPAPKASAAAKNATVEGHSPPAWWQRQAEQLAFRVTGIVKSSAGAVSVDASESAAKLSAAMQAAASQAKSLIYTTTNAAAAAGRVNAFTVNGVVMRGFRQISVLDSRTTDKCRDYHGCEWDLGFQPVGRKKRPYENGCPRHFGCRSVIVAIPAPGLTATPAVEAMAAVDIAGGATLAQWARSKADGVQRELFGAGKLAQFEAGVITQSQLLDAAGNPTTLKDLRRRYGF